jgi:ubiquitin thioesterase OTU1
VTIEDIKTYVYGEGNGYTQRVLLLYDNIHYDPLALSFSKDAPEEMDVTIFDSQDLTSLENAKKLATDLNKVRTHPRSFSVH